MAFRFLSEKCLCQRVRNAMFQVYEEKEKTWERELKKIRDLYDSRLKSAQQKALKMEQSLTTQTYQVYYYLLFTSLLLLAN